MQHGTSEGGVFAFSDAPFDPSLVSIHVVHLHAVRRCSCHFVRPASPRAPALAPRWGWSDLVGPTDDRTVTELSAERRRRRRFTEQSLATAAGP